MTPDSDDRRWHLDKRLNVGHLITTLALAASVVAWGNTMDKRVTVSETNIAALFKDNERQDKADFELSGLLRDEIRLLRGDVKELSRKDRKSTRLNSSHLKLSRMPSSA